MSDCTDDDGEAAFAEAIREALAIMACRHSGDDEGTRIIIETSRNSQLIAAAAFRLIDVALVDHGTDPAAWTAAKQAEMLAAEAGAYTEGTP